MLLVLSCISFFDKPLVCTNADSAANAVDIVRRVHNVYIQIKLKSYVMLCRLAKCGCILLWIQQRTFHSQYQDTPTVHTGMSLCTSACRCIHSGTTPLLDYFHAVLLTASHVLCFMASE